LADRASEPNVEAALDILSGYINGRYTLLQPPHFKTEICAVMSRESPATMAETLRDLTDLALPMRDDLAVYARAMQLSHELNHHLFDTLYHAVALETPGTELITADDSYFRKAKGMGRIRLLADWQLGGANRTSLNKDIHASN
jgi:predicted nucleic acid-binding protein